MTGQDKDYRPNPLDKADNKYETPQAKKDVRKARDLLSGVEDLIHQGNLAKEYKQSGGQ